MSDETIVFVLLLQVILTCGLIAFFIGRMIPLSHLNRLKIIFSKLFKADERCEEQEVLYCLGRKINLEKYREYRKCFLLAQMAYHPTEEKTRRFIKRLQGKRSWLKTACKQQLIRIDCEILCEIERELQAGNLNTESYRIRLSNWYEFSHVTSIR